MRTSTKTQAIVIKRINYKDSDRIITLYSQDLGKISAIAKGIRKLSSKNRSQLELLNHIKVELVDSHNMFIVTHVETLHSFLGLKSSYEKINQAYYIVELLEKLMPEQEENSIIYQLLLKTLHTIEVSNSPHLSNAYNVKIIKILGYFSMGNLKITDQVILQYLQSLINTKYENLDNIKTSEDTVKNTALFLKSYTEEILERELKSFSLPQNLTGGHADRQIEF